MILALAFGTRKTLVWSGISKTTVVALVDALKAGIAWNDCWLKILGANYLATNAIDPSKVRLVERLIARCDAFIDLENLQESLAELALT